MTYHDNPNQWGQFDDDLDKACKPLVTPNPLILDHDGTRVAFSSDPYYLPTEEEYGDNCPDVVYHYPESENPYNGFGTIDETPNPLSHGQFLGNFAGIVEPETIWRLGEGDETALDEISNPTTRERAKSIFDRIDGIGYWDDQSGDTPTG